MRGTDRIGPREHLASGRRRTALLLASLIGLLPLVAARSVEALWLPPGGFDGNDPDVVVAIGDSITLGVLGGPDCPNPDCVADRPYPAALQGLLQPRYPRLEIENAGRGGETTEQGLDRLPGVLASSHPGFVLIMEGTNDATFHFDPSVIVANLRAMVQVAKAHSTIPILGSIVPNFRDAPDAKAILSQVNAMLPGVAAVEDVLFVDTFGPMNNGGLFGDDRLHPTQAGYDVLGSAWAPALTAAIDATFLIRSRLVIDAPPTGATTLQPFVAAGWAADPGAASGPGVDAIHVYATALTGGPPIFLGFATYGLGRPDVAAFLGDARFTNSGWVFSVNGLWPGTYRLEFYAHSTATGTFKDVATVVVTVTSRVELSVDIPVPGTAVTQPFLAGGWAIDRDAPSGTGVDAVQLYALPPTGGPAILLGLASYGSARPDVGTAFGNRFTSSGWTLSATGLSPGSYLLGVSARSTVTGVFENAGTIPITVPAGGQMAVDVPLAGTVVTQPFLVAGWAADTGAASGTGVDTVVVYAVPAGGASVFLGTATYGGARPDVGALLGAQFTDSGFALPVSGFAPGAWQLLVFARSTITGAFSIARAIPFTVPAGQMAIDTPAAGSGVGQPFLIAGWALDAGAGTGTGVDAVVAYAVPAGGGPPTFLGIATYGIARPDVGGAFGTRFTNTGYVLSVGGLAPGAWQIQVFARSTVTGTYTDARAVDVTIP
jgi:acyl-CoA thioesterase I